MRELARELIQKHPVRKTGSQKKSFELWLTREAEKLGYTAAIEEEGFFKSRNIIFGDINAADFILTAHYDTPAMKVFPFVQMPQSVLLFFVYHAIPLALMYMASLSASIYFYEHIAQDATLMYVARYALFLSLFALSVAGIPNKHNMNDNTSGVIELLALMETMPDEYRERVAYVFFDNAENGLSGSQGFFVRHGEAIYDKLLVNFDCVARGDYIVLMAPRLYRRSEKFYELVLGSFGGHTGKKVVFPYKATIYPSDHIVFPRGICVAAFGRGRLLGYRFGWIHTPFDRKLDEKNIEVIRDMMINFIGGKSSRNTLTREQINQIIRKPDRERRVSSLEILFRE